MFALLLALGALLLPPAVRRAPQSPPLECRIEIAPGAKGERCQVTIPQGRRVRACTDADRQAGHCDAVRGRYVAWVVGTGPAAAVSPRSAPTGNAG